MFIYSYILRFPAPLMVFFVCFDIISRLKTTFLMVCLHTTINQADSAFKAHFHSRKFSSDRKFFLMAHASFRDNSFASFASFFDGKTERKSQVEIFQPFLFFRGKFLNSTIGRISAHDMRR